MRQKFPHVGVGLLCRLFGKTRNAYYDHQRRATAGALLDGLVLALVMDLRAELPRLGTRTAVSAPAPAGRGRRAGRQ